jgi:NADPH:quinone reductase-like Zn-dependent oxidoreductase
MEKMKAIRAHGFGGPEVLKLDEIPRPTPGAGELLVRVRATSVNPIDWKLRQGMVPELPIPFVPGGDFSGTVEDVGPKVVVYKKGDEVYGCVPGSTGADAEFVVCPMTALAPKPRSLDHVAAAAVPLASMTAWQALFDQGKLKINEIVLILGASGSVGRFAIQLAKRAGAHVIATASTKNLEVVRRLGADGAIDYTKERIQDVALDVDLCIDLVGGELHRAAFDVLRSGDRLVSAVQLPDAALARERGIDAKVFRMKPDTTQLREIAKRIDAGQIKVEVAKVLPLERASEAEELNRTHEVSGKIVLRVAA